jgi:uncharacterized protein YecT (DUF1311 family)
MMKRIVVLIALVSLFAAAINAQEQREKKHPIDVAYDKCMDDEKNQTTAGMTECAGTAYKAWDKVLNENYRKLMTALSPAGKQNLKASQLEWIKFRNAQFKLFSSMQQQLRGTMYIPIFAYRSAEIVKARALELQELLELGEQE